MPEKLEHIRISSALETTIGLLYHAPRTLICGTLEDEFRTVKKYGETRIFAGVYPLRLRTVGKLHDKYKRHRNLWIRENHVGMVEIVGVPQFDAILYHIGNDDDDTAGCVLPGDVLHLNLGDEEGKVTSSTSAYIRFYKLVGLSLARGVEWQTEIIDYA